MEPTKPTSSKQSTQLNLSNPEVVAYEKRLTQLSKLFNSAVQKDQPQIAAAFDETLNRIRADSGLLQKDKDSLLSNFSKKLVPSPSPSQTPPTKTSSKKSQAKFQEFEESLQLKAQFLQDARTDIEINGMRFNYATLRGEILSEKSLSEEQRQTLLAKFPSEDDFAARLNDVMSPLEIAENQPAKQPERPKIELPTTRVATSKRGQQHEQGLSAALKDLSKADEIDYNRLRKAYFDMRLFLINDKSMKHDEVTLLLKHYPDNV